MKRLSILIAFAFSTTLLAQTIVPPGTILPVRLNNSLSSAKTKPGQTITARIMQDVPLPLGTRIHAGSTVKGHVIEVIPSQNGAGGIISFQFDVLLASKNASPLTTNLRAMASLLEVDEADLPLRTGDRGTHPLSRQPFKSAANKWSIAVAAT